MRVIGVLLAILIIAYSCSSSKKSSQGKTTSSTTSSDIVRDGSSFEKAIVIDKNNESEGIGEEYKWLRENYPGYKMIRQSLSHKGDKSYDILEIETKEGEKKQVYFDITKFFGKF
jgi:hypothetical protein